MKKHIPYSVFVLVLSLLLCVNMKSFAQTNVVPDDQEFQALKALYDSLDGPNWAFKSNWPEPGYWPATATAAEMGTWQGITALNGDILRINLPFNNLTGKIPSSLGDLRSLIILYLSGNALTGNLPPSFGNLSNLRNLELYGNQLTGSIPPSFGNLTSLRYLLLSDNQLSGSIPTSFANLQDLINLDLSNNRLTGTIPQELGSLARLEQLTLNNNALSGPVPASLGGLENLVGLFLQSNQLSGVIPEELSNLSNLAGLYIHGNRFTGQMPSGLGDLTTLRHFDAGSNQFTGVIPLSYANLTSLLFFSVADNKLSSVVPEIFGSMANLTTLDLSGNNFNGVFPASIGNCVSLTSLKGDRNWFTSLPVSTLALPALSSINFSDNDLKSIPNFANHVNKTNLSLSFQNNRLDFSQLEPLINAGIASVLYNPQKTINDVSNITLVEDRPLVITARPTGQFSTVTWEKQNANGTWTALANDQDSNPQTYTRTTATLSDEGVYRWKMTNTKVTGLTLQSDPITVKTSTRFAIDDWAFQYKYDVRKRMTHKKVPGADWVYMVYDNRDRLVMTQDGEQRKENKWSFTKYDALNRPVSTGLYAHGAFADQAQMQTNVNDFYNSLGTTRSWFESFVGPAAGNLQGYDNRSFPTDQAKMELLTVTYYDNYDFMATWGGEFAYAPGQVDPRTVNGITYSQPVTSFQRVTGQVTGTRTRVVKDVFWLKTVNYYDDKYRLIQIVNDHARKGRERITSLYDFTGKVLTTKTSHSESGITWKDLVSVSLSAGSELKKTTSTYGSNAGAASVQVLPAGQDGWIEMVYPGSGAGGSEQVFGFSDANTDADLATIDYGLMITVNNAAGNVRVYESGVLRMGLGMMKVKGDVLRIERVGTQILYKVNGVTEYTSTVPSGTQLMADVTILQGMGYTFGTQASFGERTQSVTRSFDYDHAGRLLKTRHRVNDEASVLLAQNEYNELGQLVTKKLHKTGPYTPYVTADPAVGKPGVVYDTEIISSSYNSAQHTYIATKKISLQTGFAVSGNTFKARIGYSQQDAAAYNSQLEEDALFKQVVNYRYNIRGWLTRVNDSDLSVTDSGPRDYFGMNLFYNETAPGLSNQSLFNGNISAMKWSSNLGLGTSVPLLELDAPKENAYTFRYDTLNRLKSASFHTRLSTGWGASAAYHEKNLKYDLNGNIRKLDRTEAEGATMDQLSYTYTGNQLQKVADTSGNVKGFSDGPNPDNDYAYDANGNMTLDRNKDITAITYNHLNLPEKVTKNTGEYIKYTYDATGWKLSQGVYKVDNTLQKKTDYASEFFYENDTLKFINHEEGRVVMTAADPEYQYHLKDHLGNVRLTFTSKEEETSATATLEEANAIEEQGEFIYYSEAVKVYSRLFDHTNNATNGDGYAVRLTGATTDKTYGLAKSLSVMPGDTVKMEVFAKYVTGTPASNNWTGDLPGTMLAIANNTPGVIVDGGLAGSIGNQVFPFIGFIERADEESTPPKAYLNWLVFDRRDSLVDFGYIPLTTAALENGTNGPHEHLSKDNLVIREPGYVYIYLSNENETPVEVFFDDFRVEHVKSPVVQMDDYYPFGLTFNSYSRENSVPNRWKFQEQEHINDLDLNWDSFKWRNHQPDIGRFFNIDPLADKYVYNSPYAFAENRVIDGRELEGLEWFGVNTTGAMAIGSATGGQRHTNEEIKQVADGEAKGLTAAAPRALVIMAASAMAPEFAIPFMISEITGFPVLPSPQAMEGAVASEVAAVSSSTEETASEAQFVFRGDSRGPSEIFSDGLTSKGNNMNLAQHAKENPANSGFISTSTSPNVARQFADEGGYVYTIKAPSNGVNVNNTLGKSSPYPSEHEFAVPSYIPSNLIQGARQVGQNGKFTGPFIKNPNQ